MRAAAVAVLALAALGGGCSSQPQEPAAAPSRSSSPTSPGAAAPTAPAPSPDPEQPVAPGDLRVATAVAAVRHLAGDLGPRHATSPEFRRSARWVAGELRSTGLEVEVQRFRVPGGDSWGVRVPPGRSANVVATPAGLDAAAPYLLVGAHLDTVPQAPGAVDNASGVGVLLAVAEAIEERRTRLPVVLVAFGAEEPRGPTDDDHHYGSRAYVAAMTPAERRPLRGMLSLDRVGVGGVVPVCAADATGYAARARLRAVARAAGVPTVPCDNRSSDHWSFVRDGLPGLRVGGTSYAAYHSAADVPNVVQPAQLGRTGRLVLAWLAP